MKVTVVICTWNRSSLLDRTLAALTELDVPADVSWELLVVNNACTDDTDAVITKYRHLFPLSRISEPRSGKSYAANTAVRAATGDLLLWTDDDVLVDKAWLGSYVRAARENPGASFFGGPVAPWFEAPPPNWIQRNIEQMAGVFAQVIVPASLDRQPITSRAVPFGANMAIRRHCFDTHDFDVRIGLDRNTRIGGEDTTLLRALLSDGHHGVWVKDAAVRHFIPRNRFTRRYVWNWYVGWGRQLVWRGDVPATIAQCFGLPRFALRRYAQHLPFVFLLEPIRNASWMFHFKQAATVRGVIEEWRIRSVQQSHVDPRDPAEEPLTSQS